MSLNTFKHCEPNSEYIKIDYETNTISFKLQDGPIGLDNENGCTVDSLIDAAIHIISHLDLRLPCMENVRAVDCLYKSIHHLNSRTGDRIRRGVEGTSKK